MNHTPLPVHLIEKKKKGEKIVVLTAYDAAMGGLLETCGIDVILVGDSVGNVLAGHRNTLPMTMDQMIYHTQCVSRGAPNSLIVADMPFMSYQVSVEKALEHAGRFLKEAGACAVKLEVGPAGLDRVKALVDAGIPVMGHLGLTPQSVFQLGGYKMQAKTEEAAEMLFEQAQALELAGCFSIVLECIPDALAQRVSEALDIPTIGIGAGPFCDGQVLVTHDLLGLSPHSPPKFVKPYAALYPIMEQAITQFKKDVKKY